MPTTAAPGTKNGIPEGFFPIPLFESELGAMVRLCILAKTTPEPAVGHLVLLRDLPDAMVYLGCLTDTEGRLREWVEIWVQNVDGLEASLPAIQEAFSNHTLDQRWSAFAKSFAELNPEAILRTGWEAKHPVPGFVDLGRKEPMALKAENGSQWLLCQDDAVLQKAGLPAYSTSLFRYLYRPDSPDAGFLVVVGGAPTNEATRPVQEELKNPQENVAVNPQGGLGPARRYCPMGYEDCVDLLGGKPWKGLEHGKHLVTFGGAYNGLGDWAQILQSGAHLFTGGQGRAGRFTEGFHLKLRLFTEAVNSVHSFVAQQQLPFLNLAGDSFRVELKDVGARLPFLWTAQCELVKPSEAFALPIESSDLRHFIRARPAGASVYHPENISTATPGNGNVRIRTVFPPEDGRTFLEATLLVPDGLKVAPHDLLWVRLPLPTGRVDLYGHLSTTEGLAQGEARFRTVPQTLASESVAALKAAEGVSFPRSPFELVPLLSTPCDLYALGVLAVRTFLVNPQNSLAVALDEILSLARKVAAEHSPDTPLPNRVVTILNNDARFGKSLAPHRLVQEAIEPMAAFELLPPEMWYHTLAVIVSLFPGIGPDSYCKDYGDAPPLALEVVFNKPLEELDQLLVRSRSLIVIDWSANREVHSAIRDVLDRHHE